MIPSTRQHRWLQNGCQVSIRISEDPRRWYSWFRYLHIAWTRSSILGGPYCSPGAVTWLLLGAWSPYTEDAKVELLGWIEPCKIPEILSAISHEIFPNVEPLHRCWISGRHDVAPSPPCTLAPVRNPLVVLQHPRRLLNLRKDQIVVCSSSTELNRATDPPQKMLKRARPQRCLRMTVLESLVASRRY